jgi:hypothetical protein
MDQVLSDRRHVEGLAKAIAREVLRELVQSPGFEAIVEPIRHNGSSALVRLSWIRFVTRRRCTAKRSS